MNNQNEKYISVEDLKDIINGRFNIDALLRVAKQMTNDKEIQNLKSALLMQSEEIAELKVKNKHIEDLFLVHNGRILNIETWSNEIDKWIQQGLELFPVEHNGINPLQRFLEKWSEKDGE